MKKLNLTYPENMLFALLRASLHQQEAEKDCFTEATAHDWEKCYRLAVEHGVAALAWDGVMTLPVDSFPPLELKMTWGMRVKKQEKKYLGFCKVIHELTAFYEQHGIATVLLKGVGLSLMYPVPSHREGGDIDFYTFSKNRMQMTDVEASHRADVLMMERGVEVDLSYAVKHSNFTFKGIAVENHKKFVNVWQIPVAKWVNGWLVEHLHPQKVQLTDDGCTANVPSTPFNAVFIPFHAAQHYGSGLAIHHLCDWAMLIKQGEMQLPDELKDKPFGQTVAAFTQMCNIYLGTQAEVVGGKELASELMESMLRVKPVMQEVCRFPVLNLIDKFRGIFRVSLMKQRVFGGNVWEIYLSMLLKIVKSKLIAFTKNRRRN